MDYVFNDTLTPLYIVISVISLSLVGVLVWLSFRRSEPDDLVLPLGTEVEAPREIIENTPPVVSDEVPVKVKKPRKPRVSKEVKVETPAKKMKKSSKKKTASKQV